MTRFSSLMHSKSNTRITLRNRLQRLLPTTTRKTKNRRSRHKEISDELMLKLLFGMNIKYGNDASIVRTRQESLRDSNTPCIDELISNGWIKETWGRLTAGMMTSVALRKGRKKEHNAIIDLLDQRSLCECSFNNEILEDPELSVHALSLVESNIEYLNISSPSPEWVATRLWEKALDKIEDPQKTLRFWIDRWRLLGSPTIAPDDVWIHVYAESFRNAALTVLMNESGLFSWDQLRTMYVNRLFSGSKSNIDKIERYIPPVPVTCIDRFLWLESREFARFKETYDEYKDVWALVHLLLNDVKSKEHSSAPHPVAEGLFSLATQFPTILEFVSTSMNNDPALLADMLLCPSTSALASLLIAKYSFSGDTWDRDLTDKYDSAARFDAFKDGIDVTMHLLNDGLLPPEEAASLFAWLYDKAETQKAYPHENRMHDKMLEAFRAELMKTKKKPLSDLALCLATSVSESDHLSPKFAAMLDAVDIGAISNTIKPECIIKAYIRSISSNARLSPSISMIDTSQARCLVQIATRLQPESWDIFLYPLDLPTLLAVAHASGDNYCIRLDDIVLGLRNHVRVLCRAIAGWDGDLPVELLKALAKAIQSGSTAHEEKGRIPAFAAKWEREPYKRYYDQPIAIDLGKALGSLDKDDRSFLLKAILAIDEPLTLAQLIVNAPEDTRKDIRERLSILTPSEAGATFSLTELQARIEELLEAKAFDEAARFMDVELTQETYGKVPGREETRMHMQLRLHWLKGEYDEILTATIPEGLNPQESKSASLVLDFYKGLAEFIRPEGDLKAAEQYFLSLRKHYPNEATYVVNLLSVRIHLLLTGDPFEKITGPDRECARTYLAEAENSFDHLPWVTEENKSRHNNNLALLYLAIGRPDRTLQILKNVDTTELNEQITSYTAVALVRTGEKLKATNILDRFERYSGPTELTYAARAQISGGYSPTTFFDIRDKDQRIPKIKNALFDLSQMEHSLQTKVFFGKNSQIDLVLSKVRAASARLMGLVPSIKDVNIDSCEDDVTTIFRELLEASINHPLGWTVADQSRGGFSEKGNPGQRDIIIKKDGAVLAVIEAIVTRRPTSQQWTRKDLASHFQKLLGYSTCQLFFHLTYSYLADPKSVLEEISRIAVEEAPLGFTFIKIEPLHSTDSCPPGFISSYRTSLNELKVVYLVLDMWQKNQRNAARVAAENNPRNFKKAPKIE